MIRFLTVTVGVLFVVITLLYLDFLSSEIEIVSRLIGGRNLVFFVLATFAVYFFLLFAPVKQKNATSDLLLVVATMQYIPIIVVAFAYCYIEVGLDNAVETTDYLYFSIVTFTTLGYGDITPTPTSQFYAAFEALTGFIFVPVLFAQIVTVLRDFNPRTSEPTITKEVFLSKLVSEPAEIINVEELLSIPDEEGQPRDDEPDIENNDS